MTSILSGFDESSKPSSVIGGKGFKFTKKHTFTMKNNPMCGVTFWQWVRIISNRIQFVEIQYYPRIISITIISLLNSLLAMVEFILYEREILNTKLPDDPVFILGHPRTGTTLLHNTLSNDSDHFYYCSTFCAGFPSSFLWFENYGKVLFAGVIEKTRPMDDMPLHFELPQEDECATNLLSGGCSYYMPLWFMKQETTFRKYFDFSLELGAKTEDENRWTTSFIYLMKKLTIRAHNDDKRQRRTTRRRLLIKSPIHTARIPLLRRIFPKARFIYIHRDPYEVLQSAAHMADTAYWQFEYMWKKYNDSVTISNLNSTKAKSKNNNNMNSLSISTSKRNTECNRILTSDCIEISYKDFVIKPSEYLRQIYTHIDIQWNNKIEFLYENIGKEFKSYSKNKHVNLPEDMKVLIQNRWREYFEVFDYSF
eukprot:gene1541-2978_t